MFLKNSEDMQQCGGVTFFLLTPAAQVPELQKHRYFTREESVLCAEFFGPFCRHRKDNKKNTKLREYPANNTEEFVERQNVCFNSSVARELFLL